MKAPLGIAAAFLFIAGCGSRSAGSAPLLGPPGSLMSSVSIPAPSGAAAWKVRYVSTGLDGKRIEVSGVVIAPNSVGKNRPIIAYAHGTTGIAEACAPSKRDPMFKLMTGLHDMIARGFVVAATDYPGLGTSGTHGYLVGISEGRAVLDSARSARHIAATAASARFIPWGYSQGGHAALFAGQLAATYAPELRMVGVAAGAPPTDLHDIFKFHIEQNRNRVLAAYILSSWSSIYNLPLQQVLDARSILALRLAARTCLGTTLDAAVAVLHNFNLGKNFLNDRLHQNAAWNQRFKENAPRIVSGAPYFVVQGMTDTIVPPKDTTAYVKRICTNGNAVAYSRIAGMGHIAADKEAATSAVAWIASRFKGVRARSDCTSGDWQ
ncbi:MAG: lipase family protein [Candidatus Eremiobacteraeota bacterium]|nr:lipase family protein [Candidatus Eremiobacteraeota bacterium]